MSYTGEETLVNGPHCPGCLEPVVVCECRCPWALPTICGVIECKHERGHAGPHRFERGDWPAQGEPAPTAEPCARCEGWSKDYASISKKLDVTEALLDEYARKTSSIDLHERVVAYLGAAPTAEPPKPDKENRMTVPEEAGAELAKARAQHAPMHGPHEGWAVIWEELDELWDEVRAKKQDKARMGKGGAPGGRDGAPVHRGRVRPMSAKPAPSAPSPDLDPLDEALAQMEATTATYGMLTRLRRAADALRVLKRRGHWRNKVGGSPGIDAWVECACGDDWPCPTLAEAARALRGEAK